MPRRLLNSINYQTSAAARKSRPLKLESQKLETEDKREKGVPCYLFPVAYFLFRAKIFSIASATTLSGVEAPEVTPTVIFP